MLQTLVSRAFKVCCKDQDLKKEIKHINNRLRDINGYSNWIIEKANEKVKNQNKMIRPTQVTFNNEENEHSPSLLFFCHINLNYSTNMILSVNLSFIDLHVFWQIWMF